MNMDEKIISLLEAHGLQGELCNHLWHRIEDDYNRMLEEWSDYALELGMTELELHTVLTVFLIQITKILRAQ